MSETQLKNKVLRHLKNKYPDIFIYKAADKFTSGIPDLLICFYGLWVAIELKVPGKEPTRIQAHTIAKMRTAGAIAGVAHSIAEVDAIINSAVLVLPPVFKKYYEDCTK
jgi:hypothetical protein